jgi:hypothetical protein
MKRPSAGTVGAVIAALLLAPGLLPGAPAPPEIKTVVAFVFAPGSAPGQLRPWGTAFFVGRPPPLRWRSFQHCRILGPPVLKLAGVMSGTFLDLQPVIGTRRNYPVIRFGRVAMITEEKVKFGDYEADLYLVETGSYGGNSGSPAWL